jgi:hypothetical protein
LVVLAMIFCFFPGIFGVFSIFGVFFGFMSNQLAHQQMEGVHALWNHRENLWESFVLPLFVRSTVQSSVLVLNMRCSADAAEHKSWSPWLCIRDPSPPTRSEATLRCCLEKRRRDLKKVISVTPIYLVPKVLVPFRFLDGVVNNLTCILRVSAPQMSSWTCMSKMWSCVVKDSWKMVDVSQVMISNTITCKIHTSRLTTHVWNELNYYCSCTEILALMSMKLELLSPLLSDSPFLSSKSFSDFRCSFTTRNRDPHFAMFFEGFWHVFFCFPIFDVRSQREIETHILPCFLRTKYSK